MIATITSKDIIRGLAVFSATALLLTCASMFLPVHGEEKIYDEVLRLHVIANSDSLGDQSLKLQVRNAVITAVERLTDGLTTREQAEKILAANLPLLEQAAAEVIHAQGSDYPVTAVLTHEVYPAKSYDTVTLPAGRYDSLQIRIGASEGRNWWCILFPPICLNASQAESELKAGGFTNEQIALLTQTKKPRYAVRFKILEWLNRLSERQ